LFKRNGQPAMDDKKNMKPPQKNSPKSGARQAAELKARLEERFRPHQDDEIMMVLKNVVEKHLLLRLRIPNH